jgi:hypothetical protein
VRQLPGGVLEWTSPIGQVLRTEPEPVGPVFTDLPRRSREPTPRLTPAEKRRRRAAISEQMQAETARWNDPATRPEPPPQPTSGPWAEHGADWTGPPPPF